MLNMYNPANWYWAVTNNSSNVFSSASMSSVSVNDKAYKSWLAQGNTPTNISANDMLLLRISWLEQSVTPRMLQEAASGSTETGLGADGSMTSIQYIALIRSQIAVFRSQLT